MPISRLTTVGLFIIGTAALLATIASKATLEARQAQFVIPVAASSLAQRPDAFIGKTVSMAAAVERQLSPTAFSVDQDATSSTGPDVLVLAPTLLSAVEPNTYVTVQGEVMRFDPATLASRLEHYRLDLSDDLIAHYTGRPVVIATSVITAGLEDIAKVPPPPMSRAEQEFDAVMKRVSPAFSALRAAIGDENAAESHERLEILKAGFADAERFFTDRGNSDDAVGWAKEAQRMVSSVELAVDGGFWELATAAAGQVQQQCAACHGEYRIQLEDGSYRVKFGG